MRHATTLLLLCACTGKPAPTPPAQPPPADAQPADVADASPPTRPGLTLSARPTHQQLAWIVDVLAKRDGIVTSEELAEHCERKLANPVVRTADTLRAWSTDTKDAVVTKLEVDDPTYIRAILESGSQQWRLILEIDATSNKITFLQRAIVN